MIMEVKPETKTAAILQDIFLQREGDKKIILPQCPNFCEQVSWKRETEQNTIYNVTKQKYLFFTFFLQ